MSERRPMTPARIQAWDRRRAAIHEAGHIVVGRHFGCPMIGQVHKDGDVDDPLKFNTWTGQAGSMDGKLTHGTFEVGVAGVLAELRYSGDGYYADDPDYCWEVLSNMSPTDRDLAGVGITCEDHDDPAYCDVAERAGPVYELVCRLWPEIWAASRELIDEHKELRKGWRRRGV